MDVIKTHIAGVEQRGKCPAGSSAKMLSTLTEIGY